MGERLRPRFRILPLGKVRPAGWFLAQMRRDLEVGFFGCLDRDYDVLPALAVPPPRLTPEIPELGLRTERVAGIVTEPGTMAMPHPWDTAPLVLTDGRITLVPMGCTPLRHAAFFPEK